MKNLFGGLAAISLALSATAAHAETRPAPTEFSKPVTKDVSAVGGEADLLPLILLGLGGLIGILLAAGSSDGNSPR